MGEPPREAFCKLCERPTYACGCDTAMWKARALAAEQQVEELLSLIEQEAEHWSQPGQWLGPMEPPVSEESRLLLKLQFDGLVVLAKQIKGDD